MLRTPPTRIFGVALVLALALSGCDLVERYFAGAPEDQLVEAALAEWTTQGAPFLSGVSGRDTVASVSPTGARAWEVAVIPINGGSPVVWSLSITKAETYPVFPGEEFGKFLAARARELGMRTFLPPAMLSGMASGAIQGVGELEVRYGLADRSGRNTEPRIAFFTKRPEDVEPQWRIQTSSRSVNLLLQSMKSVTDDMLERDDRLLSCMGAGSASQVSRDIQLACIREVWTQEFAPGP